VSSGLNRYRCIRNRYRYFLPLFPAEIENFDLMEYGLVISSSHCVAKGVIPPPDALHISYIHSPMRYIWDQYPAYFGSTRGIRKSIIKRQVSKLRSWDVSSSSRVDHFIANSRFVKKRIWKYYRRESDVIHPPADIEFFQPSPDPERKYFLAVSALVPYKMNQLLVEAFNRLGERLIIVGRGSEEKKLKKMAGKTIEFKKDISTEILKQLYQNARALVFAGIEDFGISFVEAQACGIPVVAFKRGGVLDIVEDAKTGILFDDQRVETLMGAIEKFKTMEGAQAGGFESSEIRKNSLRFSAEVFKQKIKSFLEERL
jgi:glycosyltransferase involved in cell wall biosynthesis